MLNLRKGTWTGICCLLALLLGSAPARSQTSFAEYSGFYTIVDDNTKAESLMRLEFLPGERDGFMLATVFGANGSTGSSPDRSSHREGFPQCQFRLLAGEEPSTFDYECSEQGRTGSSGRVTRLRN